MSLNSDLHIVLIFEPEMQQEHNMATKSRGSWCRARQYRVHTRATSPQVVMVLCQVVEGPHQQLRGVLLLGALQRGGQRAGLQQSRQAARAAQLLGVRLEKLTKGSCLGWVPGHQRLMDGSE